MVSGSLIQYAAHKDGAGGVAVYLLIRCGITLMAALVFAYSARQAGVPGREQCDGYDDRWWRHYDNNYNYDNDYYKLRGKRPLPGWWRGLAVTRCVRSTRLLYTGPG